MKFEELQKLIDLKSDFDRAKSSLEKYLSLSSLTLYFNSHTSLEIRENRDIFQPVRQAILKTQFATCELYLKELENLGVDVDNERAALTNMLL